MASITSDQEVSHNENPQQLDGRKQASRHKLRQYDSLDIEYGKFDHHHRHGSKDVKWSVILSLAIQSIGVVYGDLGTCPLYVFASTFTDGVKHNDDILGVLSLIFYTITLIPLIKYVFIVLRANDNGDGGTFALYSLICRYAKVSLLPSQEAEDRDVSTFKIELPSNRMSRASRVKSKLENSKFAKHLLLFATMLGTSMVIGDGVFTPCVSVLSTVGGIKQATSAMTEERIVWISVVILVCLFMVQRFGTDKVGYSFAPMMSVWFTLISSIGVYNFVKYDPTVVKAINPKYIVDYFRRNKKDAWISLGGVILSITVYPSVILAYTGQASFLRKHNDIVADIFYKSVPDPLYWPMFVVAVMAAIIASQAVICGTFSVIQQSLSLGCFPRVKVVHKSSKYEGQVYIPEINYLLMLACVAVTLGFRTTAKIGNAYGTAVVCVMKLTSSFLVLIMIMIWKTNILLVIAYIVSIGTVELLYLSSVLYKFDQGGYLPLAFAMIIMSIMYVWNSVYRRKYYFELENKISSDRLKEIVVATSSSLLPGLAIFYSELVHGIPPIFNHYLENVPALHSVLVFVSIKSLPISRVPPEERFLFRRVQPHDLYVFRCVVRYGYTDVRNEEEPFERLLVGRLKEFIKKDYMFSAAIQNNKDSTEDIAEQVEYGSNNKDSSAEDDQAEQVALARKQEAMEKDVEFLDRSWRAGVVHLVGEHEVIAGEGANIGKKILIDYAYNFLKRNLRQTNKVFDIPHKRMLKVGMTVEL